MRRGLSAPYAGASMTEGVFVPIDLHFSELTMIELPSAETTAAMTNAQRTLLIEALYKYIESLKKLNRNNHRIS
jgi:hypothetical protein